MPVKKHAYDKMLSGQTFCLDSADSKVGGSYDGNLFQAIYIQLHRCSDKEYCMDDGAITEYFKRSALLLLHNQIRFDASIFGRDSITRQSDVSWVPIST